MRVLSVDSIHKKFCKDLKRSMLYGAVDLMKDFVGLRENRNYLRQAEYWALDNVSFHVDAGEAFALVGSNGSGKSTMLRLIAGIFPPDLGSISVRGRIGSLIALGAGFHPNLSGRENIYINAALLGLSKRETDSLLDEIIGFSELETFIDAPVSTYSSGMTVRLGFSIAVNCRADLLLVDEVLAVGDLAFALKCHERMLKFRESGGTIILVSHSNQLIRNVCDRAIWIDKGKTVMLGPANDVLDEYERFMMQTALKNRTENRNELLTRDQMVRVTKVETLNEVGVDTEEFEVGKPMTVRIHFSAERPVKNPIVAVWLENMESITTIGNYSANDGQHFESMSGKGYFDFKIARVALKRGYHFVSFSLNENNLSQALVWGERTKRISIFKGPVSHGIYNPFPDWSLVQTS